MTGDGRLLVERLAEHADRNRFTLDEFGRLLRLCLQLERDCPGVQFVVPEGSAASVERELQWQAQSCWQPGMVRGVPPGPVNRRGGWRQA